MTLETETPEECEEWVDTLNKVVIIAVVVVVIIAVVVVVVVVVVFMYLFIFTFVPKLIMKKKDLRVHRETFRSSVLERRSSVSDMQKRSSLLTVSKSNPEMKGCFVVVDRCLEASKKTDVSCTQFEHQ